MSGSFSRAALCTAALLVWSPAPLWACGPMDGPASPSPSSSPSPSGGQPYHGGGDAYPGRGQVQRQGVDSANAGNLDNGSGGGRVSGPDQPPADLTGSIAALGDAEAKDEAAKGKSCDGLRAEAAKLQAGYDAAKTLVDSDMGALSRAEGNLERGRQLAASFNRMSNAELNNAIEYATRSVGVDIDNTRIPAAARDTLALVKLTGRTDPDNNPLVKLYQSRVDSANQDLLRDQQTMAQGWSMLDAAQKRLIDCDTQEASQNVSATSQP